MLWSKNDEKMQKTAIQFKTPLFAITVSSLINAGYPVSIRIGESIAKGHGHLSQTFQDFTQTLD